MFPPAVRVFSSLTHFVDRNLPFALSHELGESFLELVSALRLDIDLRLLLVVNPISTVSSECSLNVSLIL